eukprot:10879450-Karenia_brevis.AAC.1
MRRHEHCTSDFRKADSSRERARIDFLRRQFKSPGRQQSILRTQTWSDMDSVKKELQDQKKKNEADMHLVHKKKNKIQEQKRNGAWRSTVEAENEYRAVLHGFKKRRLLEDVDWALSWHEKDKGAAALRFRRALDNYLRVLPEEGE